MTNMTKNCGVGRNYKDYVKELESKGYKCTYYGETINKQGLAYYETETSVLKLTYEWIKVGDNHYVSGKITEVEDVTSCYR